MIGVKIGLVQS